jgi:hypothetical protein
MAWCSVIAEDREKLGCYDSDMNNYEPPNLVVVGTLAEFTADSGPSQGLGSGKGSLCPDGSSGLEGNRSCTNP